MDDGNPLVAFALGMAAMWGYTAWNGPPTAIENAQSQIDEAIALVKEGSGQVALIHGFLDDYDVCTKIRYRLEAEGGAYSCWDAAHIPPIPQL